MKMNEDYPVLVEKKLPRMRRYSTLGAIRRELLRLYEEAKERKQLEPIEIQRYRMLCFLLSSAGELMRTEKLDEIERRISVLERQGGRK